MASDISIKGYISVIVDPVDIEQAEIESPIVLGQSLSIRAMIAARHKENFKSLLRAVSKTNHTLEYDNYAEMGNGYVLVTFKVRENNKEESMGRETYTESFNRIFGVK